MRELVFEVVQEADGGYCAHAIGEGIFTQGDTWTELKEMVVDATSGYFQSPEFANNSEPPTSIRLHVLAYDELLAVA